MAGCTCTKCGSLSFVTFAPGVDVNKASRNWVCLSCWKEMSDEEQEQLKQAMKEED